MQAELCELELQASGIQQLIGHASGPTGGSKDEMGDEKGLDVLDISNLPLVEDFGEEAEQLAVMYQFIYPAVCRFYAFYVYI